MFHKNITIRIRNFYYPISLNFKSLIMRAIFFRFLSHKTYIWNSTHSSWVKRTIFFTKINSSTINRSIRAIWNNCFSVFRFIISVPHLSRSSDHSRHRSINYYIRRNMKISNSLIRIYHCQVCIIFESIIYVSLYFYSFFRW